MSSQPSAASVVVQEKNKRSRGRWLRRLLIAAGVLVALIAFGFWGLPPIIKAQAIKHLSARLGRTVTIERIRLNPLTLSTTIEGFSIAEAGPATGAFTGWKRLYVNFDSWSVFAGEFRFQEIMLEGFHAHVAREKDGTFSFADIIARVTAPDPAAPPVDPKAPKSAPSIPRVAIAKLDVVDARVAFNDDSRGRPFETAAGPLTFTLKNFRTAGGQDSICRFEAVTKAGEHIAWQGNFLLDVLKSEGEFTLKGIDLARLSPYYYDLASGDVRSAFLDASGHYSAALVDGVPVLKLSGGAFTLRDLRFGAPGVAANGIELDRIDVTDVSADSSTSSAAIGRIKVQGVRAKITRDADGIDLLRLIAPKRAVGERPLIAAATTVAQTYPKVTLGELSVSGVSVEAVDTTTPRPATHRIEDLSLVLRDLDVTQLGRPVPLELTVKLPQDGLVAVKGTVSAQPLAAELDVAVDRMSFASASPYVEPMLNVRLAGGAVRTQGHAALKDGVLTFAGNFGLSGFASVDGKRMQDFVKWTDLAVTGIKLSSKPLAFHADEIRFVEPSATLRMEADGTLSILNAVAQPTPGAANDGVAPAGAAASAASSTSPATSSASVAPAAANQPGFTIPVLPISLSIDRFAFENAAMKFEDQSIKPAAHGGITAFTGSITGIASESLGRANIEMTGKVDGVAPVSITGRFNFLDTPAFVDLKINFKGIDLHPGAGPYIGRFAGRELTRGNLNVDIKARLNDVQVSVDNVITLDQFYLGAKTDSPVATKLPVNLALALLRDNDGRIVLDVPVKGRLDDPSFQISRVVLRVIVNILVKAASSPFSLIGAAFGGGGEELGYQTFAAGETKPLDTEVAKLDTLRKALKGRPALNLDITGSYDAATDIPALRERTLDKQIRYRRWEELRAVDPAIQKPDDIVITPVDEARLMALFVTEQFPGGLPVAGGDATATATAVTAAGTPTETSSASVPAPAKVTPVAPPARVKARELVSRRSQRVYASQPDSEPASAPAPVRTVVIVASTDVVAPAAPGGTAPLTLADARAALTARIEVTDTDLRQLAEARAQHVREVLLQGGEIDTGRLFLTPPAPEGKGARVLLQLR